MRPFLLFVTACLITACEQLVVCNPENFCEGTTAVHCDLVCASSHPKSTDLPKDCERKLTKVDCAAKGQTCGESPLGGAPGCLVNRPACDPKTTVTTCANSSSLTSCVLFSGTKSSAYQLETYACPTGKTCSPSTDGGAASCAP